MFIDEIITTEFETRYQYYLRIARRFSKTDAEDLVQESFFTASQAKAKFKGSSLGELRAWLIAILRNNSCDFARKRYRRPEGYSDSLEIDQVNKLISPVNNIEQALQIEEVKKKLDYQMLKLSKVERNAIQVFLTFGTVGKNNSLRVAKVRALRKLRRFNIRQINGI